MITNRHYSQVAQNKLRTKEGFLPKAHKSFYVFGKKYELAIAPELMIDERGNNKAFYPSANEGLVEDALRKSPHNNSTVSTLIKTMVVPGLFLPCTSCGKN